MESTQPSTDLTLFSYLLQKWKINYDLFDYLQQYESKMKTYKDFAFIVSLWVSCDENEMTVDKSSTWAICQEFIGNLSGDLLDYSKSRGGIWIFDDKDIVSFRSVITDLQEKYPFI